MQINPPDANMIVRFIALYYIQQQPVVAWLNFKKVWNESVNYL